MDSIQVPTKKEVSSKKMKKAKGSIPPNSREYFFSDNMGGGVSAEQILKMVIPDWFDDGSQYSDQLDKEIANRLEKFVKEMKKVEENIAATKREKVEHRKRFNQNVKLRNRL